jgi:hypothetical protein
MLFFSRNATNSLLRPYGVAALGILLLGSLRADDNRNPLALRADDHATPVGSVAWYQVGRAALNPATGQGFAYGFYTQVAGINSLLFSGAPNVGTAFFTFRSSVYQLVPLPANGDIGVNVVLPDTFNVYVNATPNADWTNPDSFSSGQLVATFSRKQFLLIQQTANSTGTEFAVLTSSQKFTFGGATVDIGSVVSGATITSVYSNTPLPGVTGFPVGLAFAGHAVITGAAK